jgi:GH18 family chitinase
MQPENLPAGILTHINVGYETINENGTITDVNGPIMARMTRLRRRYTGLRVNLAIGGYEFNNPSRTGNDDTLGRWSDMVGTVPNQIAYINSLVDYMLKYSLDGVDIDWRYPGIVNRGGTVITEAANIQDYTNFVVFVGNVKEAFAAASGRWQITVSVPYDYAKLKGFQLDRLARNVDWFNVQAYDMYDLWDRDVRGDGFIRGHSNITAIANTLDLFALNGVPPEQIVMGLGFHGTSYTLNDVGCTNPGCRFLAPGFPADCTNDAGFLSYGEVMSMVPELGSETHYDKPSASKWLVYSLSQWISYDDSESFADKTAFLVSRCLRGWAVWSLDLDTQDYQGLTALVGERAMLDAFIEDQLNPDERKRLVHDLAAYTGQECFVSTGCTDGANNNGPPATCPAGYMSVETGHFPLQIIRGFGTQIVACPRGQWHHVCCPADAMPRNCEWSGAPEQSEFGCTRGCSAGQFELTRDTFTNAAGTGSCFSGERSVSQQTPLLCMTHIQIFVDDNNSFVVTGPKSLTSVAGPIAWCQTPPEAIPPAMPAKPKSPADTTKIMAVSGVACGSLQSETKKLTAF